MRDPEQPGVPRARWTGPERLVKKYLLLRGWQVVRAGRAFALFHLVALHPTEGVKLIWVSAPRGPEPDLVALSNFACDRSWSKEVWRYPGYALRPVVARLNGGPAPVSRENP